MHGRCERSAKDKRLGRMFGNQMATWTAADGIADDYNVFWLDILFFSKKVVGGFDVVAGLFGRCFSCGSAVSRVVVCENAIAMHLEVLAKQLDIRDSLVIPMAEQHDGHTFFSFHPQSIQRFAVGGQLTVARCWRGWRRWKQLFFNGCTGNEHGKYWNEKKIEQATVMPFGEERREFHGMFMHDWL